MDGYAFYYDAVEDNFTNECGGYVYNIFEFISPNDLEVFKYRKEDMGLFDRRGYMILLVYPGLDSIYNY